MLRKILSRHRGKGGQTAVFPEARESKFRIFGSVRRAALFEAGPDEQAKVPGTDGGIKKKSKIGPGRAPQGEGFRFFSQAAHVRSVCKGALVAGEA